MTEIIFLVQGGFTARALGESIFIEAREFSILTSGIAGSKMST